MNDPVSKSIQLTEKALAKNANKEVVLPEWPTPKRATPNAFLRSALFSAIQSKDRIFLDRAILASQEGITVKFTGKQLNQEDLTLWETLVHLAKTQPLGNICEFTAYDILKTMGHGDSGEEREILHEGIIRLGACMVEILVNGKNTYFSSLVDHGVKNEETGHYTIQLSKSLIKLYAQNTWVDFKQRANLKRKPLAQYLHGYYSSHKAPYPVKIETIYKLSGSKTKRVTDFKKKAIIALDVLVEIGFLVSYEIDEDRINVKKK